MTVLLDSVLLIDHFKGVRGATAYRREMQASLPELVIDVPSGLTMKFHADPQSRDAKLRVSLKHSRNTFQCKATLG